MDIGKDLTKRQQEIFDFIKRYSASYGYPPTVRDIGKAVGLASSSTVHAHLANLEKVGLLRRDPSKPRAIELLDRATATATSAMDAVKSAVMPTGLPLLGQVAAGQPLLAEENIEEYVQIPEIAGGEDGEYLLRVRGDSMINAGILPDDVGGRPPAGHGGGRRDRRGAGGGGGDGQAVLPGGRPRPPAARERDAGADPLARGAGARPRRRRDAEGRIMSALMAERRDWRGGRAPGVAVRRAGAAAARPGRSRRAPEGRTPASPRGAAAAPADRGRCRAVAAARRRTPRRVPGDARALRAASPSERRRRLDGARARTCDRGGADRCSRSGDRARVELATSPAKHAREGRGPPGRADARRCDVARMGGSGHGAARGVPGVPWRGAAGGRRAAARALHVVRDDDRLASARDERVDDDRAELAHLEEEWMSAMQSRDMDRLEELVAHGFRFTAIHLYPEPMSREQWMGAAREGYTITSFAFETHGHRRVRRHGGDPLALLAGRELGPEQPVQRVPADGRVGARRRAVAGRRPPLVDPRLSRPGAAATSSSRRSRARTCGRAGRPRPSGSSSAGATEAGSRNSS